MFKLSPNPDPRNVVKISNNGIVPASLPVQLGSSGNFNFLVEYYGDSNYGPSVACESSSIMSINVVTTITYSNGEVPPNPHSVIIGSTVVDNAIIRGITPPDQPKLAGGTITYQFFSGARDGMSRYCSGNHSDSTFTIDKTGKIPTSFSYNAWIPGSYAYRAVYDGKYGHIQSDCESLLVFPHPP